MFRIRLANGEEAVYRSIEELALGIQSGVLTPDAEVYHARGDRWLPIESHPEYAQAVERAAVLVATTDTADLIAAPEIIPTREAVVPIYQMFSKSGREIEARRRPRWVAPATTAVAGAALLLGLAATFLGSGGGGDEAYRPILRSHLGGAKRDPASTSETSASVRNAPYNLAARMGQAADSLSRDLGDSAARLGMRSLLDPTRLSRPDTLQIVRTALQNFRPALESWRQQERQLSAAYRDTATQLYHSSRWSRAEFEEWKVRAIHAEAPMAIQRVDSLMLHLDQLYTLLLNEQGTYQISLAGAQFGHPGAGAQYEEIRAALIHHVAAPLPTTERVPASLSILLQGIAGRMLPPRINR